MVVHDTKLELNEEIKRSTALAQHGGKQSSTRGSNHGEATKEQLKTAFYEDLTNIRVHSCKRFESEELGPVSEFVCDATTSQKSMYIFSSVPVV